MKRIIVDTNILICLMKKNSPTENLLGANGFATVDDVELRSQALLDHIESSGGTLVLPAPVLAEYLLGIEGEKNKQKHTQLILSMSCFEILPFDELAAIECSLLPSPNEFKQFIKSEINSNATANKIRYDRQIISIAKANNIDEIWSGDKEVSSKSTEFGMEIKSLLDIQPMALSEQITLNLLDETPPSNKNQLN
nr:PIN domain-containing protein [Providencia rettgeri]